MLGKIDENQKEVTIIGAGIAGLLAAYSLDKKGYRVSLYEEKERSGGLIQTKNLSYGMVETAAHSLLATQNVYRLFQDLDVELTEVHPKSKARFIYRDGKMRRMPLSLGEMSGLIARSFFKRAPETSTTSVENWARTHLGEAGLQYLLSPFLTGIYAASPAEINVQAAFPSLVVPKGKTFAISRFFKPKKKTGPTNRQSGRKKMVAPKKGMGALVNALQERLEHRLRDRFHLGKKITTLPEGSGNRVLSVPASAASKLLEQSDPKLSKKLQEIDYTPLVTATVFVRSENLLRPPKGVGVLIPKVERKEVLGVLFNSSAFENRVNPLWSVSSYTVMLGGTTQRDVIQLSDEEISERINRALRDLLGMRGKAEHIEIHRWPRAIPLYSDPILNAWKCAEEGWCGKPGNVLFGNYTGQVSLRGMIESAAEL